MSEQPFNHNGSSAADHEWEAHIQARASAFPYPATPDIANAVHERLSGQQVLHTFSLRRLIWVAIFIIALLCGLMAVPQVRAAILDWLRIGSVIVLPNGPSVTPPPTASAVPSNPSTPVPPTATLIPSLLNLAGETTLDKAQQQARFTIDLPTYPSDLGTPNKVFLQELSGQTVILVWTNPAYPDGVRLSLHILTNDNLAYKMQPKVIQETTVHKQHAVWLEGPYVLAFKRGTRTEWDAARIVNGNVLLWTAGKLTYRLEGGGLTLEEAVKIAESIPIPAPQPSQTPRRTATRAPSR